MPPIDFKELVEGWLAKAVNPASGMEAELQSAQEKIRQLEHKLQEERKIFELKHQEDNIQAEKHVKVIMIMAREITNLQEGKSPELARANDKVLKDAQEKVTKAEKDNKELSDRLERTCKTLEEVIETRNTLMKVVESVSSNNAEVKKTKKNKLKIQCRDFDKPNGCQWGEQCRFLHGVKQGLEKTKDCSYWMDGECRYPEKVCWNKYDPAKKGHKSGEENASSQSVFQGGQQDQRLPPGQQAASRMDAEGWMDPSSRK